MLSETLLAVLENLNGNIALAFSHQAEDVVALALLKRHVKRPFGVFTLDTGKNFEETKPFHMQVESFFDIRIEQYFPNADEVAALEADLGEWGMRGGLDERKRCCQIRKVNPLRRALSGKTAWLTGLRAEQSITREHIAEIEYDGAFGLLKFNPLAHWTARQVFAYIDENRLPLHPLYRQGFKSIGCKPCTRAVRDDEDARAGRWWWEAPEHKECGLHIKEAR
jgi:phosphoadenosine phosphosulfate reductase